MSPSRHSRGAQLIVGCCLILKIDDFLRSVKVSQASVQIIITSGSMASTRTKFRYYNKRLIDTFGDFRTPFIIMIPPDIPYALKWSIPTIRPCSRLAFSPSALWLAGVSIDGFLILMQAIEGNIKYELDLSNGITTLTSLPGPGDTFVCGHDDGSLTITTIEPDQVHLSVDRWTASADSIEHLAASAASEIATCSSDEISLWIFNSTSARWIATGKHCNLRHLSENDRYSEVRDLQFMTNALLISHRREGLICLNRNSMETTWIVRPAFEITRLYISDDNLHILATTVDGMVRMIPFQDGTSVQIDKEQVLGIVADSPSGASFGYRDTEVLCLSVDLKKILWTTRIAQDFREIDDGSSERIMTFTTFRSRPGVNAFFACSYGPATRPPRVVVWEHRFQTVHPRFRGKTRTSTGIPPTCNFKRVTWEIHDGDKKQELDHGDVNEAIKNVDEPVEPDFFKDSHGTINHASPDRPDLRPLFEAGSPLGSLSQKLGVGVMVQPRVFDNIVTVIASSAVLLLLVSLFLKLNGLEILRVKTAWETVTTWMSQLGVALREPAGRRFELITHLTSTYLEMGRLYISQCTRSLWSDIHVFLLHLLGGVDNARM